MFGEKEQNGTPEDDNLSVLGSNAIIKGDEGNDDLSAQGSDATLQGDGGNDTLSVNGSSSNLSGGDGNDELSVNGANSILDGNRDDDILSMNGAEGTLKGGDGNDILSVNGAGGTLDGGDGDDTLSAVGKDTLTGAGGNDTFYLSNIDLNNLRNDTDVTIQDFQDDGDKLIFPQLIDLNDGNLTQKTLAFPDLAIAQQGENTTISYQDNLIATLIGVQAGSIGEDDFIARPNANTV